MTQAELDALPDVSGGFGEMVETVDGKTIRRPVLLGGFHGAFWHKDDDPTSVVDAYGQGWMIGRTPEGVLCKRRA